jgi:hypothetical protein
MMIPAIYVDAGPIALDRSFSGEDLRWEFGSTTGTPSPASYQRKCELLTALQSALSEADEPGWDGYKAKRADPYAFIYALGLLDMLPLITPLPEITVDTDGDIALEWNRGARRLFSVRVSRDGTIYYAGLVDYDTFHGSQQLREGIPRAISEGIGRVIRGPQLRAIA